MALFDKATYSELLYGPIYLVHGTATTLALTVGDPVELVLIDKTDGVELEVADGQSNISTVLPAAAVRATELEEKSVAIASLVDATFTLGGVSWRIKSTRPRPNTHGEAGGEFWLVLEKN